MYDLVITAVDDRSNIEFFHKMFTRINPSRVDSLMNYNSDIQTPITISIIDVTNYVVEPQQSLRLLMVTDQSVHSTNIIFDSSISDQNMYYKSVVIHVTDFKNVRIIFLR